MTKLIMLWLLVCSAVFGTSLTGTIVLPNGVGVNGTLALSLSQQAALQSGGCGGPKEIIPGTQVLIKLVNGALTGSPTVYGNDCMLPNGTYYNVQITDANGNVVMTDRWLISGSSIDVGTIISVVISGTTAIAGAPGVVLTSPTSNQTVSQPGSTQLAVNRMAVTGQMILPNGSVCTATGCTGSGLFGGLNPVLISGTQTITGSKFFTSPLLNAGGSAIGSFANPFQGGYFDSDVWVGNLNISLWSGVTVIDFFSWQVPSAAVLNLEDSSSNIIMHYENPGTPLFTFNGNVMPTAGQLLGGPSNNWGGLYVKGPVLLDSNGVDPVTINAETFQNGGWTGAGGVTVAGKHFSGTGPVNVVDVFGGALYIPSITGTDLVCNTHTRGNFAYRLDTNQMQICNGSVLKKSAAFI